MMVNRGVSLTQLLDHYLPEDVANHLYIQIFKFTILGLVGGCILGALTTFLVMR